MQCGCFLLVPSCLLALLAGEQAGCVLEEVGRGVRLGFWGVFLLFVPGRWNPSIIPLGKRWEHLESSGRALTHPAASLTSYSWLSSLIRGEQCPWGQATIIGWEGSRINPSPAAVRTFPSCWDTACAGEQLGAPHLCSQPNGEPSSPQQPQKKLGQEDAIPGGWGGNGLMSISSQGAKENGIISNQSLSPHGLPIMSPSGCKDVFESCFETG